VFKNGVRSSLMQRRDDGWTGEDMGVGDLCPRRDAVVARGVLLLYGA
jgi:hypothetical protein